MSESFCNICGEESALGKKLCKENAKLHERIKKLEKVLETAKAYQKWLPNMELIGAAKHSEMLVTAMELRARIKELEGGE